MSEHNINWSKRRLWYAIAAILLFLTGTYFYFQVQRGESDIKNSDLEAIDSLVLSEKPVVKQSGGRAVLNYIEFKCLWYSKSFQMDVYHYACANPTKILNDLKAGDTISVKLMRADISAIGLEASSYQIHSLIFKAKDYLDLDCRNKKAGEDSVFGYYICFIMAPLTLIVAFFKKKPTCIGSVEPAFILCIIGFLVMVILKNDIFN